MGSTQPGETRKADCALYGFAESPSDWGRYRDSCLRKVEWSTEGHHYAIAETPEKHVWKIMKDSKSAVSVVGICVCMWMMCSREPSGRS